MTLRIPYHLSWFRSWSVTNRCLVCSAGWRIPQLPTGTVSINLQGINTRWSRTWKFIKAAQDHKLIGWKSTYQLIDPGNVWEIFTLGGRLLTKTLEFGGFFRILGLYPYLRHGQTKKPTAGNEHVTSPYLLQFGRWPTPMRTPMSAPQT